MKRARRYWVFLLVVALLVASVPTANAAVEPRSSSYFCMCSAFLSRADSNSFYICFTVTGLGLYIEEIGATSIRVERSTDATNWETVQRYSYEDYPEMLDYNSGSHGASILYSGETGYYYRAVICLYCKNENGRGYSYQATEWLYM